MRAEAEDDLVIAADLDAEEDSEPEEDEDALRETKPLALTLSLEARLPLLQPVGTAEADVLKLAEPLAVGIEAVAVPVVKKEALSVAVSAILPDFSVDFEMIKDKEPLADADDERTADCDKE